MVLKKIDVLENKYFSLLINESIDVSIVEALCIIV